jgi:hypothetical protein
MHSSFMLQVGYYMQIIWPHSAECQKSHETVRDTTTYITLQCGWKVKGERWNGIINSDFNFKTKIGYNQQTSFHNRNYFFLLFMFTYYLQDEPVLMLFSMEICVTNDHEYVLFVVIIFWSFPHSCLITKVVAGVTRRV